MLRTPTGRRAQTRRRAPRPAPLLAALAVLSLMTAACSGTGGTNQATPDAASDAATGTGTDAAAGEDIVIGRLLPLTGSLAEMGTRVANGAEIARRLANADPCLPGRQFVWNTVDAPDDEAARTGAERLLDEGVDIVYGTFGSSLALVASAVVARGGGLFWEEGATAEELTTRGYDKLFRTSATASHLGRDAMRFVIDTVAPRLGTDIDALTVGWAGVNNSYGLDVLAGIEKVLADNGHELVVRAPFAADATDLSAVALQIKDADPDIMFVTNYPQDAAILGRAMREANVTPQAIIGTGAAHADPTWVDAMGADANGYFNVGAVSEIDPAGLAPEAHARHDAYVQAYTDEFGFAPAGMDRMGFDGAYLLFEAICAAGTDDPDAVAAAARTLDLPERSLLNGDGAHFDASGQNERVSWPVSQWQDGRLVPIAPTDLALGVPALLPLPPWGGR